MSRLLLLLRRIAPSCDVAPQRPLHSSSRRSYVSRAHAEPTPTTPIQNAIRSLLDEMDERHRLRLERWERNKDNRVEQRVSYLTARGRPGAPTPEQVREDASTQPYRRMDETVELAIQLNLDPRKPGQALRGSMKLPHGNGRKFGVAVFTDNPTLATAALEAGAVVAGGISLVESIKAGSTSLSSFQRTLATSDMTSQLSSIARLLGPRGLMPNPKIGTIVPPDELLAALADQMSGVSNYRTDKEGIVRLGIGRGSFGMDKLLDNVREVMNEIHAVKPESFGKGKKGQKGKVAKGTKYYLKAHLSATQGRGSKLVDIRTIDPTSAFFMSDPQ
jgi:large subunit ribosomal protein L1